MDFFFRILLFYTQRFKKVMLAKIEVFKFWLFLHDVLTQILAKVTWDVNGST